MTPPPLDRRGFLQVGGGAAAAGLLGLGPAHAAAGAKARVVLVRRREVLDAEGRVNGPVIHAMLNEALCALLGEKDAAAAWRRVVKPGDVVGVKSNVWDRMPTPAELEQAIRDEVVGSGVAPANVAVDDRGVRTNPVFQRMTHRLYEELASIRGVTLHGPSFEVPQRAPTVSFTMNRHTPADVCTHLAERGICAWDGHFYALRAIEKLGLLARGGVTRAGVVLYNTAEEVERLIEGVKALSMR